MTQENVGGVTIKGNPLTTIGSKVAVGDKAPDFKVTNNSLEAVSLSDSQGKTRLISVIPSLDTGICDAQTRRFNEEAAKYGDNVAFLTI